ncbi:AAA domain-containing protein [Sphingobacterium thalpophilum]|uniref:AAA domain-containing protein n=1 Tax=Sphingobacterium thalpophilum TaxID=259 RepID=A0ABV4HFS5_9SPHI
MDYFDDLINLLEEEQQYDKIQHETLLLQNNLNERRMLGVTWFPIRITDSELGRGDYLTVSISRANFLEFEHKFRFGMPVSLFSNHAPETDRIDGVINWVGKDQMRISFRVDELPDWTRRGKLGVDLLFDEHSYRQMFSALQKAKEMAILSDEGIFIRKLIGAEQLSNTNIQEFYHCPSLNASQNRAVQHILDTTDIALLHGPPGTGKTTTLVKAVVALLQNNRQVLVVAPSNTAVDLLTERLDKAGVRVTRIGNPIKVSEHLQELTLDGKIDQHRANTEIRTLRKQVRVYTDMAQKYKRHFGKAEREQRKALYGEAHRIQKDIDRIQDFIVEDILDSSQVITATLIGANQDVVRDRQYDTVVIDEAAQALEPACWIPILKTAKLVLAGDHCQLPPTVKSNTPTASKLHNTLFEKLIKLYPQAICLLDVQYRMNEQIMQYPSAALYGGLLKADDAVAGSTLPQDIEPILFIDTAGAGYEETETDGAISNIGEARFLKAHLKSEIRHWANGDDVGGWPSIGIIAPYRQQVAQLIEIFEQDEELVAYAAILQVQTIDSFQGQEKDIIYISLTRSNFSQQIGFLSDVRRMNVAMTRAKKKLVVIGDSATIGTHPFYKEFIGYAERIGHYHSVWEWDIANL